jgi:hypothetical protein
MKNPLKIACLLLCIAAVNINAAPFTFYTNETDFLNALSGKPFYQEDFATVPQTQFGTNTTNFSNGTFSFTATIPSIDPPNTSLWGETFAGNAALSTGDPAELLVLTNFSLNTAAFGGYFFPSAAPDITPDDITLTIFFGDLTSTNLTTNRGSVNFADWFFGWVTDEPGTTISSVTLTGAGVEYSSVADVTLAVPEPSTYALLGLAAAGLAGYVIRRRRS